MRELTTESQLGTSRRGRIRVRWWIFGFMFAFAMLAFIQRTSVAVAAESIVAALGITQMQIGMLNAAFLTTYTLMQIPAGALGERYGVRRTYTGVALLGLLGSLATPLLPLVFGGHPLFLSLLMTQCFMGVSQAPVFPLFATVIEKWFPRNQWALANGFQSSGMLLGGAVTPPLIVWLTGNIGWQGALLSIGAPAALLLLGWAWYGRDRPEEHPAVRREELAELAHSRIPTPPITVGRVTAILRDRNILLLTVSYLCMNYTFYLLTFWSFLYLVQVRHFSGLTSGLAGMLPWICAAVGAAYGGYVSDRAVERLGLRWGYRIVPLVSLSLVAILLIITISVDSPWMAVLTLGAAFACVEVNEGGYWAATMRTARSDSGAAAGVLNTGGNLGGILCQPVVAWLTALGRWDTAFITGAVLAVIGALLWLLVDTDRATEDILLPQQAT